MTRSTAALAALLTYSVLTVWIDARWAWSVAESAVFGGLLLWCICQLRRPSIIHGSWKLVMIGAAPSWGLLQLAAGTTVYRAATWNSVLTWTTWLALFFLALQIFEKRSALWFFNFAVCFGFFLSLLGLTQMYTSGGKIFWLFPSGYTDYVMGPFVYRNHYAAFLELLLPVAVWRALREPERRWWYCSAGAVMLASVVAAAARAGSLLMCLEIVAVCTAAGMYRSAGRRTIWRVLALFAVMAVSFSAISGWQALRRRMWLPDPLAGRREFVLSSLEMLRDHPFTGVGLGNWPRVYPQYALFDDGTFVNQAHNDWLQWAAEGGLPLILAMAALACMSVRAAWRSGWGIGILAVWMHALVEYPFQQRPAIGAWFFVMLGLLAAARHGSDESHRERGQQQSRRHDERAGLQEAPAAHRDAFTPQSR